MKADDAPVVMTLVNEEKQKELKLCLSRLRLRRGVGACLVER